MSGTSFYIIFDGFRRILTKQNEKKHEIDRRKPTDSLRTGGEDFSKKFFSLKTNPQGAKATPAPRETPGRARKNSIKLKGLHM